MKRELFSQHREEVIKWINKRDSFNYKDLLDSFDGSDGTIK